MSVPTEGLTPEQLRSARSAAQPFLSVLNNQSGATPVLETVPDATGAFRCIVAATVRKLRRALYPMSEQLREVSGYNYTPETEARRRAIRGQEYPEPVGCAAAEPTSVPPEEPSLPRDPWVEENVAAERRIMSQQMNLLAPPLESLSASRRTAARLKAGEVVFEEHLDRRRAWVRVNRQPGESDYEAKERYEQLFHRARLEQSQKDLAKILESFPERPRPAESEAVTIRTLQITDGREQ